ncbi:MAG: DUF4868 domain-containing protein [Kangiella sp.]|nr:DUF4868 domain-containing protein [Kangiella sp.]
MNITELKSELRSIYNNRNNVGVAVYALLKNGETNERLFKVDIENAAEEGLKNLFLNSIHEDIIQDQEITIMDLSSCDERANVIYRYDLDDIPEDLSSLEQVIVNDDIPLMDLNTTNLSNVKALIIEVGNNQSQVALYKTMAPVNIFGRSSFFMKKSNTRFTKVDDEFLRVSPNFQFLKINNEIFILDIKSLEKYFGFHELIIKEASEGIDALNETGLIDNIETLNELLEDLKYARKLTRIKNDSPVLQSEIENSSIINFCESYPSLRGRIKFNEGKSKIILDTKVSKDLFLKVMMDDLLTSELTQFHYESKAKDTIDSTEVSD